MDVSEKLVEILQDENNPVWRWFPNNMAMMQLVDYLISSGVTVQEDCKDCAKATQNCIVKLQEQIAELRSAQEWVSVEDRLPEESGMYIVTANDGHAQRVSFVQWQKKNRMWNLTGERSYWRVTHWMPMPHPPKGE